MLAATALLLMQKLPIAKNNKETELQPSFMPSYSSNPSSGPSMNPIKNVLLSAKVSEDALNDEDSPQGKVYLWVSTQDLINPPLEPGEDDDQIIQRFVLATFYYATGGDGWTNKEGWLGGSNECNWYKVICSGSVRMVTRLFPSSNNLVGSIPSEVGQLKRLGECLCLHLSGAC